MNIMLRTATYVAILAGTFVLTACGGPKLSDAKAQYDRGEYFDAAKTYRKIYNKLTKKRNANSVAKSPISWDCAIVTYAKTRALLLPSKTPYVMDGKTQPCICNWHANCTLTANMPRL